MTKLSRNKFDNAKFFIMNHARELERARFQFLFENGKKEDVIAQLRRFQNEDGGFGNGIEPDFWVPQSSPMATWFAGQFLLEVGAGSNEPIVKSMMAYLMRTNDFETGMWTSVLPENNDYPHAPWWHWHEGVQKNWMFNPSIELAAFLIHWSPDHRKAKSIAWNTIQKAVPYVMEITKIDRHELMNFQQCMKLIKPYEEIFEAKTTYRYSAVKNKIMDLVESCIDKDVSSWSEGYKTLPLDFIDSPEQPLYSKLRPLVDENLSFYINQLNDDGVWDITWEWGSYPEQFKVASRHWQGILAVNRLLQLKAFNYLEEL